MSKIAIYPGTFDPVTLGHQDLIQRAAGLFDKLIVAVAVSARKDPFYDVQQRVTMIETVTAHLDNVSVQSYQRLTIDLARNVRANAIIRGLRAVSDFDFEFQMAGVHSELQPEIITIFIPASVHVSYVSATVVREIYQMKGDISAFVDSRVIKILNQKKND